MRCPSAHFYSFNFPQLTSRFPQSASPQIAAQASFCPFLPAPRIPMMRQLLDVVHQAIQLPLRIYFFPAPQCEPVQPLVVPQVAKHRFHDGKALAVLFPAFCTIQLALHPVGVTLLPVRFAPEEGNLSCFRLLRRTQALVSPGAR